MELILQFLLFCGVCVVSFYLPGYTIVKYVLQEDVKNFWIESWVVGIVAFILGNYIFSWLHIPYLYLVFLLGNFLFIIWKRKHFSWFTKAKIDRVVLLLIMVGTISFVGLSWNSGIVGKNGQMFVGLNAVDGITHIAYIKNQVLFFPPQHPEIANVPLRGYHYFYDFLLSRLVLFFHFRVEDIFFRFAPLLISLLYGFSFYSLVKNLTKNILSQRLIIFFIYFGSGFSYFLSLLRPDFNPLTAQPIDIILDPSMILGITILATIITILPNIKKTMRYALLIGMLVGLLAQIKVYVGIIGIIMLILFIGSRVLWNSWKQKWLFALSLCTTVVMFAITFLPNNFNSGRFIFAPFNFYNQFMQQAFFTKLHWGVVMEIYRSHNNYLRLVQMTLEAVALYWIINIGIRLIVLFALRKIVQKSFWLSDYSLAILSVIGTSILFPSLFIQSPSPFEVMQFTWITNIFIGIPAGIVLGGFLAKRQGWIKGIILVLVVVISLPQVFGLDAYYLLSQYKITFAPEEMGVFNMVNLSVPNTSYYIVLPDRLTYTTQDGHVVDKLLWNGAPLTTALTGKRAYYEGNATPFSHSITVDERIHTMFVLSNAIQSCDIQAVDTVMQKMGSKYLLTYYPQPCLATSSAIMTKQETKKYSYYQFR